MSNRYKVILITIFCIIFLFTNIDKDAAYFIKFHYIESIICFFFIVIIGISITNRRKQQKELKKFVDDARNQRNLIKKK